MWMHSISLFNALTRYTLACTMQSCAYHAPSHKMVETSRQGFFSRDVVWGGGELLLWGEKNVKNIQKTNEICYCLGGKFET